MAETKTIDTSNIIEMNRLEDRIDTVNNIVKRLREDLTTRGTESTKTTTEIIEKMRMMDSEINHLKGITYPNYWENEINNIKDIVYKLQNELREEVNEWSNFRKTKYFQVVTYEEMANCVKQSGAQLKEIAVLLDMDISTVSRMLNGKGSTGDSNKKKEDGIAYHKIKQYCLEKMAKR